MTSQCLTTKLRDVHYNQCYGERDVVQFLSDPRVRKFILYRLRRYALLKRVKMQNTLSGVQEIFFLNMSDAREDTISSFTGINMITHISEKIFRCC